MKGPANGVATELPRQWALGHLLWATLEQLDREDQAAQWAAADRVELPLSWALEQVEALDRSFGGPQDCDADSPLAVAQRSLLRAASAPSNGRAVEKLVDWTVAWADAGRQPWPNFVEAGHPRPGMELDVECDGRRWLEILGTGPAPDSLGPSVAVLRFRRWIPDKPLAVGRQSRAAIFTPQAEKEVKV